MSLSDAILWPGSKLCRMMGIDPDADAGLLRWMFNTLIYLTVALAFLWFIMA